MNCDVFCKMKGQSISGWLSKIRLGFKNVNSPECSEDVYLFLAAQQFVPRDLTVTGRTISSVTLDWIRPLYSVGFQIEYQVRLYRFHWRNYWQIMIDVIGITAELLKTQLLFETPIEICSWLLALLPPLNRLVLRYKVCMMGCHSIKSSCSQSRVICISSIHVGLQPFEQNKQK